MKLEDLPTWKACDAKRKHGETLSRLENFIYNNEPSGFAGDHWRIALVEVFEEVGKS